MYLGSHDELFDQGTFDAFTEYFSYFEANLTYQYIHDFIHAFPSNLPPNETWHPERSCAAMGEFQWPTKSEFRNCGYNLAYYMLSHIFSPYSELQERALNYTDYGTLREFWQGSFTPSLAEAKMDEYGYIYIPNVCLDGKTPCKSLIFLHGCLQGAGYWKETEVRRTGLLEYAATNNIIVVFPQNNDSVEVTYGGEQQSWKYCWSDMTSDDI